jgi:hypothetical protein
MLLFYAASPGPAGLWTLIIRAGSKCARQRRTGDGRTIPGHKWLKITEQRCACTEGNAALSADAIEKRTHESIISLSLTLEHAVSLSNCPEEIRRAFRN